MNKLSRRFLFTVFLITTGLFSAGLHAQVYSQPTVEHDSKDMQALLEKLTFEFEKHISLTTQGARLDSSFQQIKLKNEKLFKFQQQMIQVLQNGRPAGNKYHGVCHVALYSAQVSSERKKGEV